MPETVVHFQIRVPPNIHERLASWAKEDKASLNMLIVGLLGKGAGATQVRMHRGRSWTGAPRSLSRRPPRQSIHGGLLTS